MSYDFNGQTKCPCDSYHAAFNCPMNTMLNQCYFVELHLSNFSSAFQSFLGRKSLDSQLQRMGALSSAESISQSDSINDKFKKCKVRCCLVWCI